MKVTYQDFPLDEVVKAANEIVAQRPGTKIFQKFTCSGCGERLTIDVPNEFHPTGSCDRCPAITDIRKQGCNYMIVYPPGNDPYGLTKKRA
jgi:hypothetical protein